MKRIGMRKVHFVDLSYCFKNLFEGFWGDLGDVFWLK